MSQKNLSSPVSSAETRRIYTDNKTLRLNLKNLKPGDRFIGRLRMKPSEEYLLVYLLEKGVQLFPSALSQLTARSKVLQAELFAEFMVPDTYVIHDIHDLINHLGIFGKLEKPPLVTKQDRANAGFGIHLWSSIEEVYNQASLTNLPFPFVLQPFYPDCRDIRVIILDEYIEAYCRDNPDNFRNNLHCGGRSYPHELTEEQLQLCRTVLNTGDFPYGHIDLMITRDGSGYLGEINLRGGIRGAKITPQEYTSRIEAILSKTSEQIP